MEDGEGGGYIGRIPSGSGSALGGIARVDKTGLALVHEGECIVSEPGCEAVLSADGAGVGVNYYFPVEIEVVGALSEEQVRQVSEYVFDELSRELSSRV